MAENPYSPPSAASTLANGSIPEAKRKSAWLFVGVLLFAFLSGATALLVYRGLVMTVRMMSSNQSQSDLIRSGLSILLVITASLLWLWTSRSFWLANYRNGCSGALLGVLAFVAGFVIAPLVIERVP